MQAVAPAEFGIDDAAATRITLAQPPAQQAAADAAHQPERVEVARGEIRQGEADADDRRPHEIDRGDADRAIAAAHRADDVVQVLLQLFGLGHGGVRGGSG